MDILKLMTNLVYPNRCYICGELLECPRPVCSSCKEQIELYKLKNFPSLCSRCYHTPQNCICDNFTSLKKIVSPFFYEKPVRSLILTAKTQNIKEVYSFMAEKMIGELCSHDLENLSGVSYVPAKEKKITEIGFNHGQELANAIAKKLNTCLVHPPIKRLEKSLIQHELSFNQRQVNAWESYVRLENNPLIKGKILLVDDVVTTGFTLDRCAEILLQNGADEILGVSFSAAILD